MIYIFVLLLLLFLSYHYDICSNRINKKLWYNVVLVILILIAGLRYRLGTDTSMYIGEFYHIIPKLDKMKFEDLSIRYPLWKFLMSVVHTFGGKFFIVQLVQSSIVNILLFNYIRRHSYYIFTCVLIYYLWVYTSYNMEIMKSSLAIVVCLYGNDFIMNKEWTKGYLLYFIAFLFHYETLLILVTPLFFSIRFNLRTMIFLGVAFILGSFFQQKMEDYTFLFGFSEDLAEKAEFYATEERFNTSKGWSYFVFLILPYITYVILSILYLQKRQMDKSIQKMEALVVIGLFFAVIQINIDIFYRYVQFYIVYFIIYITQFFVGILKSNKRIDTFTSFLLTTFVFSPFFFCLVYQYPRKYFRYYPYYSVIERKIDKKREHKLQENRPWRDLSRIDEY